MNDKIKSAIKTLKGFAREVPEMTGAALCGAWGNDSARNFFAWLGDWSLRLACWSLGMRYPYESSV